MPLLASGERSARTPGDKRRLAIIGVTVAAALTGAGVWSAVNPGSYDRSHAGCITVTVPSSTGGALLHECGAKARASCHQAFREHDRLALLTRPQCRQAGLGG